MINNNFSRARISTAASGNTTIVSGATGKVIKVYRLALGAASAVDASILDGSTELQKFRQLGSLIIEDADRPVYVTTAANNLVLNLSSAVAVDGSIWYVRE